MDESSDIIYVQSTGGLPGTAAFWFSRTNHTGGEGLTPGQTTTVMRGFVILRTWIITYLGDGIVEMRPKRNKWHRKLRGDGIRKLTLG